MRTSDMFTPLTRNPVTTVCISMIVCWLCFSAITCWLLCVAQWPRIYRKESARLKNVWAGNLLCLLRGISQGFVLPFCLALCKWKDFGGSLIPWVDLFNGQAVRVWRWRNVLHWTSLFTIEEFSHKINIHTYVDSFVRVWDIHVSEKVCVNNNNNNNNKNNNLKKYYKKILWILLILILFFIF